MEIPQVKTFNSYDREAFENRRENSWAFSALKPRPIDDSSMLSPLYLFKQSLGSGRLNVEGNDIVLIKDGKRTVVGRRDPIPRETGEPPWVQRSSAPTFMGKIEGKEMYKILDEMDM